MNTEEIKDKVTDVTHDVDDFVDDTAEKHAFPKWKFGLGLP